MKTAQYTNLLCALVLLATCASANAQQRFADNTATVEAPRGIIDTNPGNNSATDSDTIELVADLTISKSNPPGAVVVGSFTTYTIVANNLGPSAANNSVVADNWTTQPGLDCSVGPVTCAASGTAGTACPAPASVTPAGLQAGLVIPTFPRGGVVTFTLRCLVTGNP